MSSDPNIYRKLRGANSLHFDLGIRDQFKYQLWSSPFNDRRQRLPAMVIDRRHMALNDHRRSAPVVDGVLYANCYPAMQMTITSLTIVPFVTLACTVRMWSNNSFNKDHVTAVKEHVNLLLVMVHAITWLFNYKDAITK